MSRISIFSLIISKILLLSSLFLFVSSLSFVFLIKLIPPPTSSTTTSATISNIHDGDTIYMTNSKQAIRLIGIDAPELAYSYACMPKCTENECGALEARDRLKNLILNHEVVLESDVSSGNTDIYSRFLRYVFLCPTPFTSSSSSTMNHKLITLSSSCLDISLELIRQGLVKEASFGNAYSRQEEYKQAEVLAREGKKGIWGNCSQNN